MNYQNNLIINIISKKINLISFKGLDKIQYNIKIIHVMLQNCKI